MDALTTNVRRDDPQYQNNRAHHLALDEELRQRMAQVREGGGPERHDLSGRAAARQSCNRRDCQR